MFKKIIYSTVMLLIGILIYYLSIKGIIEKTDLITSIIRNYVPDILWILSFYSYSTFFSKSLTKNYIIFTAFYVISLGLIFEYLQFTGVVHGTFDFFDVVVYIISTIVACLIEKLYWRDKI